MQSGDSPVSILLLTVSLLGVLVLAGVPFGSGVAASVTEGTGAQESVRPGERLTAVVGVGEAELEGELEIRSFAIAFRQAATNESKASVIAGEVDDVEQRLSQLEDRKRQLRNARDNGTLSEGEFRARMAVLGARSTALQRIANQTTAASSRVPESALQSQGVDREKVRALSRRASNLTGPEVAKIARSIAGPSANRGIAAGNRPNVTGPPEGVPGNGPPNDTGRAGNGGPQNSTGGENQTAGDRQGNGQNNANGGNGTGQGESPPENESDSEDSYGLADATPADRSVDFLAYERPTRFDQSDSETTPLFAVEVSDDGSAQVTLHMTFDLTSDSDQRAFSTLQDDEQARTDVKHRYRDRLRSVANSSEKRVERDMRVYDSEIWLNETSGGDVGIVSISVAWDGLAAVENGHLVITEPFASGFTPSRVFRVRILVPDRYRLTTATPKPAEQSETSAAWEAGTSLNNFTLAFAPEGKTPLPEESLDKFSSKKTTTAGGGGSGLGIAFAIVLLLVGVAVAAYKYRDRIR